MTVRRHTLVTLTIAAAALAAIVIEALRRLGILASVPSDVAVLALAATGLPLVARTAWGMLRGQFAADIVASLAIVTAFLLTEPLAGLVVVLMQSGGELLERHAEGRASRAVRALEEAAPRFAHRIAGEVIDDVPIDAVAIGDLLLIRPGEMVPCDATVVAGRSHLDTASITGEPVPRAVGVDAPILSGSFNREAPLTVRVTAPASESQYARIVQLVRNAQASRAPLQRLADRYAVWFTPATIAVAALAYAGSGDPLRVLSVLVVATPCPLILAVPVAIIGGVNRAARHGIIVRSGTALEQIGSVNVVVFDKTGTLTIGQPRVAAVIPAGTWDAGRVLALAAAVELHSSHLLARSIVDAAGQGNAPALSAAGVIEIAGRGVRGTVAGHDVVVGSLEHVLGAMPGAAPLAMLARAGVLTAFVGIDGAAGGAVEYEDRIRPEAPDALATLARLGIARTLILSGDARQNTDAVARSLRIAEAQGNLLAEDKVAIVERLRAEGHRVLMMGDGTNDAPALESAHVGVAIAPREAAITAEAADIVLLADDLRLLPAAIEIGRSALGIARQSIWVGLGLSGVAMLVAAAGYIPPTVGALLQEAIDVTVILNALRSAREPGQSRLTTETLLPQADAIRNPT